MPPRKKTAAGPIPVEDIRHDDKRANIPTGELRDFAAAEETGPPTVLYPRDPSLDPQLVWKGKDTQDREDLAVPAVPIYVQEKIVPRALVENLRRTAERAEDEPELTLFDDFDGVDDFSDKVDFYAHEANWSNRMILGDSLLAMTSLAEKERLRGKVQMVYMDPPYGIRFGSNWQVSTRKRDVKDGKAEDATRQPEQVKAFRDTWELGIHSYLAYLRDRLVVARDLLTESGSCFVQIGDENVHLVRAVMDEVFGSENFVVTIVFRTTSNLVGNELGRNSDYALWFAKDLENLKVRKLFKRRTLADDVGNRYTRLEDGKGRRRNMTKEEREDHGSIASDARPYTHGDLTSQGETVTGSGDFAWNGAHFRPGQGRHWTTTTQNMRRLEAAGRLVAPTANSLRFVRYLDDFPVAEYANVWTDTATGAFTDDKTYVVQTNTKVIERCLLMTTDPGDLVLDPTCGSGTTAYVAEQWGRRWITTDTSRVALTLARTRLMSAKLPYYFLADSPEGSKREAQLAAVPANVSAETSNDVRKGFVYKRVPHVTLKSIANNPDITEGMTRAQVDAAIAKHADTELLFDQPYEDKTRIRVAGPFTMESLAPHRVLAGDEERPQSEQAGGASYEQTILDNLRKAGVQNGVKVERLTFDRVEPYAGTYVQAIAHAVGADGSPERIGICLGPQYGTVDGEMVKEAAKEALKGAGFDLLLVCGFAFDARAGETAKEFAPVTTDDFAVAQAERKFGRLPVLLVRMNPDLAMGDALLKATGAGNLFTVFGEPDVTIEHTDGGGVIVEVRGVDVYDPTSGTVRSSSTDDIACWFIDSDYDQESFFVRHAYFTGADEPYAKLQRALRAEIDEDAWASLYRTRSRPFPLPTTGRIAVKVVNHYGDEVLQVYEVRPREGEPARS